MWLFATSCSKMMYHPSPSLISLSCSSSNLFLSYHYVSLNEGDWVCLPTIFPCGQEFIIHRHWDKNSSIHTPTCLFGLHLLLSFPPQSIIIFFSQTLDYACLTSFIDTPKINLLHLFCKNGCLAWYFRCIIFRSHSHRPSDLYLYFSDDKTTYPFGECFALNFLLRTSSLKDAYQSCITACLSSLLYIGRS